MISNSTSGNLSFSHSWHTCKRQIFKVSYWGIVLTAKNWKETKCLLGEDYLNSFSMSMQNNIGQP